MFFCRPGGVLLDFGYVRGEGGLLDFGWYVHIHTVFLTLFRSNVSALVRALSAGMHKMTIRSHTELLCDQSQALGRQFHRHIDVKDLR